MYPTIECFNAEDNMEVEYRLDTSNLLKRAIHELYETEIKKWTSPIASAVSRTYSVFDPINLEIFLNEFGSNKKTHLSVIRILDRMVGEMDSYYSVNYKQCLYEFVESYFAQTEEYRKVAKNIKNYLESEKGIRERVEIATRANSKPVLQKCYAGSYLEKLREQLSYFPYGNYNALQPAIIVTQHLQCANKTEKNYFKDGEISRILDFRDYAFSAGFYPEHSYLDGKLFTEEELTIRKFIKETILEEYLAQIMHANMEIRQLIQTLNDAIDNKWGLLLSKYKRGTYRDEWGVTHEEIWQKTLRYFALNVAIDLNDAPDFLVYLKLPFDTLSPKLKVLSSDYDRVTLNLILKPNYEIGQIHELNDTLLKSLKNDSVVELCSFLFDCKLKSEVEFDEFSSIDKPTIEFLKDSSQNTLNSSDAGRSFEFWVKEILEKLGYEISLTPITGDQGVDIIATRNGKRYAIQCKSYTGQVGNAAVQEVIAGKIFYDCDHACVITNSNFTPSAYQLAAKAGVIMCANENFNPLK